MASQWQNFLANLGAWQGSFTGISPTGTELKTTLSLLSLEAGEQNAEGAISMVRFRLQRFEGGDRSAPPSSDLSQEYRSLGRQVVFFDTGTFCKGSLQLAPGTVFGGEFGFVHGDRRHRLVLLYTEAGDADQLVLIREYRVGSGAQECPPLTPEQLQGSWQGSRATIAADWPEPDRSEARVSFSAAEMAELQWLADGGYCRWPQQVSHREAFSVEAGWLTAPDRLERLIRCYDGSGAWVSATHEVLER
ncbi:DUF3598 family protein [Synechococcus sp. 8F6]|jgi:hypothetical protein|uniref:DUF3598 family protein n=1 Tax=Synechococcus sp. 8F6 TaxID=2025606 RepID=UPI000B98D05F|nr:DUF3598 family protein [Synechococcus sp. 8F6]